MRGQCSERRCTATRYGRDDRKRSFLLQLDRLLYARPRGFIDSRTRSILRRATPHERIPVTQGICGAAVRRNETIIVENIASDPRYLSCSLGTKSEIVAPIRTRGCVVGEIDVDSDRLNAFQLEDREFLEKCAEIVGQFLDRTEKSDPN